MQLNKKGLYRQWQKGKLDFYTYNYDCGNVFSGIDFFQTQTETDKIT